MSGTHAKDWCGLEWTEWIGLDASNDIYRDVIPTDGGIYRIRATEQSGLVYLGQTGRDLRERTGTLRNHTHRSEPPWNDPHTGAPGLWAWRVDDGLTYELSVTAFDLETPERECLEDMLLLEHRLEHGESTLCNHGRFHPKWRRPTNKAKGVSMQRLPEGETNPAAGSSLAPVELVGTPGEPEWLGLSWTERENLAEVAAPKLRGVYLLLDGPEAVYAGKATNLRSRVGTHRRSYAEHELSVVCHTMPDALLHHLYERETDLIGALYKHTGEVPRFQY